MRSQKGVSLITLIITIIVVIILAVIILRSGASDAPDQASFSGFTSEMGDLQDAVKAAMLTAKGSENIRGNNRTDAQLYNFVARGGYDALPENADGDAKWLIQADASTIPCTPINKKLAEKSIGTPLPLRKVETDKGANQELSYYVTPKGNVFCWPPYLYDGKSYVAANLTVKAADGVTELDDTKATVAGSTFDIKFSNGEVVKVENLAVVAGTPKKGVDIDKQFTRNSGDVVKDLASVFYGDDDRNTLDYKGVAGGYLFDNYANNQ